MMCTTNTLEEPDVVLYVEPFTVGWSGVRHRDKGIVSRELTSVCNTLLQVLMHIPSFVVWLSKSQHLLTCQANKTSCLLCVTSSVLQQLDTEVVVHPVQFCDIMKDACDDAHNVIEDILLKLHGNFMSVYAEIPMNIWSERTSPIFLMFGGLLEVSAACCGTTFEPFLTLNVPIGASTLQSCLDGLVEREICKNCKCAVKPLITLHTAPTVLIINIERFMDDGSLCDKELIIQPDIVLQKRFSYSHLSTVFVNGQHIDEANFYTVTSCPNGLHHEFTDASFKKVNASSLLGYPKYLKTSYMAVYELRKVAEEVPSKKTPLRSSSLPKVSTPLSVRVRHLTSTQKSWNVSPIAAPSPHSKLKTGQPKKQLFLEEQHHLPSMSHEQNRKKRPHTFDDNRAAKKTATNITTETTATTTESTSMNPMTTANTTSPPTKSVGVQVSLGPVPVMSLANCWNDPPEEFRFYTGVTQANFLVLYKLLGGDSTFSKLKMEYKLSTPSKNENKFKFPLKDRLYLTLLRLRRGTPLRDLGKNLGISKTQASEIFYAVLRHMFLTFQQFKGRMLLSVEDQKKNMPKVFKPFKNLRMIIDGAEFKFQVPSDFQQQGNTYSEYKTCNTAHFITGINLYGGVSFVSEAYEGAISDKQATIDSKLLDMFQPGDALMTDKGFDIIAECLLKKIKLLQPPYLGPRDKFSPKEVLLTKALAKARIYVEHFIGKLKDFRLIRYTIPNKMMPYIEDMVYVCACLTNFDPPHLIKKTKKRKAQKNKRKSMKPARRTVSKVSKKQAKKRVQKILKKASKTAVKKPWRKPTKKTSNTSN